MIKFNELWVFPEAPRANMEFEGHPFNYLRATFTLNAAKAHTTYLIERTLRNRLWSDPIPKPVRFATSGPALVVSCFAPRSFWCCVDRDNGEPNELEGKVYVFAFETRAAARAFYKHQNQQAIIKGSHATRVFAPIQLIQQG